MIKSECQIVPKIILNLSEIEARALHGITVYGVKQFLEVFKDKLGTAYIQDYEQGLISLFNTIKEELPKHFNRINKTNQIWADLK